MSSKEDYEQNIADIIKYAGNYSGVELSSLVYNGEAEQLREAFGDAPAPDISQNDAVNKLIRAIMTLTPKSGAEGTTGKFTNQLISDLEALFAGESESNIDSDIKTSIRITPLHSINGNVQNLKYFINGPYLHSDGSENTNQYTLYDSVPLQCHSSFPFVKKDSSSGIPSNEKVNCSIIEILRPGFGPTARDTKEVAIFSSMIPTLEISRCIPYFKADVKPPQFVYGDEEKDKDRKGSSIEIPPFFNIIGFLKGDRPEVVDSLKSLKTGADEALSLSFGVDTTDPKGPKQKRMSMGGGSMELFTTPQTMMTERGNLGGFTNVILDRMRPFMTISSVKITTNVSHGWSSYKEATMDLVLHDRSRLNLIAPLLRPEITAGRDKTTFYLEYGWSHPEGTRRIKGGNGPFKNPIGAFLHGMRVREAFEVYNVNYSFADSGQVNISLKLVTKGQVNMSGLDISITEVASDIKQIDEKVKSLNEKFNQLQSQGTNMDTFKEIFPEIIMNGVASADSAQSMNLEKAAEMQAELQTLVRSGGSAGQVAANMQEIIQTVKKAQDQASTKAAEKMDKLMGAVEIFPVAVDSRGASNTNVSIPPVGASNSITKKCVSLGRVLYAFVAAPLASTRQFAEVQLIFHPHNKRASFMRSLSIARHPLDANLLKNDIVEFIKQKPKMSIGEFMSLLNDKHLSNDSAFAYGFSKFMPRKAADDQKEKVDATIFDKQALVIESAGILDGTYMKPAITLVPECIAGSNGLPILRMHVTDSRAVVHSTYVDMLKRARDTGDQIISTTYLKDSHPLYDFNETLTVAYDQAQIINYLQEKGVIGQSLSEIKDSSSKTDPNKVPIDQKASITGSKKLKLLISKGVPTIRYGQSAGTVSSIGVSSMSDPALTSLALARGGQSSALDPSNADQLRGVPMRVTPSEMSLEMLGCPMIMPMQSFFVDLDTMTTLDSIYTISSVDHSLSPGSFTTSVKLLNTGDAYSTFRSSGNDAANAISRWLQEDAQKIAVIQQRKKEAAAAEARKRAKEAAEKRAAEEAIKKRTAAEQKAYQDWNASHDALHKSLITLIKTDVEFRTALERAMGSDRVADLSRHYYGATGIIHGVFPLTNDVLDRTAATITRHYESQMNTSASPPDWKSIIRRSISKISKLPQNEGKYYLEENLKKAADFGQKYLNEKHSDIFISYQGRDTTIQNLVTAQTAPAQKSST